MFDRRPQTRRDLRHSEFEAGCTFFFYLIKATDYSETYQQALRRSTFLQLYFANHELRLVSIETDPHGAARGLKHFPRCLYVLRKVAFLYRFSVCSFFFRGLPSIELRLLEWPKYRSILIITVELESMSDMGREIDQLSPESRGETTDILNSTLKQWLIT